MKRRIFASFAALSLVLLALATLLLGFTSYRFYEQNAKEQVQQDCALLLALLEGEDDPVQTLSTLQNALQNNTRLTLIDREGTVLFDSDYDAAQLESHSDREEIQEAFDGAFGESTRYSSTLQTNTYNYALRLNDNTVLRFCQPLSSISSVFVSTLPMMALLLVVLLGAAWLVSLTLTRHIITPIGKAVSQTEQMLKDPTLTMPPVIAYDELTPFVRQIKLLNEQTHEYIQRLKRERDTINNIVQNMQEGFLLLDENKRVLTINPSARVMLDIPHDEPIIGQNLLHIKRDMPLQQAIANAQETRLDVSYLQTDALKRHYRYFVSPVCDEKEVFQGTMVFILDVTEQIELDTMRRDFTANVSHELKTPLTSISGFAQMMENGMLKSKEDICSVGQIIDREATRLISLISDIIRLSQIESQQEASALDLAPVDIKEICEECVHSLAPVAQKASVRLDIQGESLMVPGDKTMLSEVVYNLCENAIKYNRPNGSVQLILSKEDNMARLEVKDTGIGIPAQDCERIFERFYRVDKSRSKDTGGTGLGLSIVKHAVMVHKGRISVHSTLGQGTSMVVLLPLA